MACGRWFAHGPYDMASMRTLVRRYLAHRRKMGYLMTDTARRLPDFGRFVDRVAPGKPLTTAIALQWATSGRSRRRATHARLLEMVRGFARYCSILDARTEVPDTRLLGPGHQRIRPHIFTKQQTGLILSRARALTTHRSPLHPLTYETLVGLLACTGIRPGEALRLRLGDFNPGSGQLRIAPCKFSPERLLPLHATAVRALVRYRAARQRRFPFGEHLLLGGTGRPLLQRKTEKIFARLTRGILSNGQRCSLRLLDFRHAFASNWISEWSRRSKPVSHHLLLLARHLGHQDFSSTWWYISSDPKSLQAAARSFLRFHNEGGS
jgi:integrase